MANTQRAIDQLGEDILKKVRSTVSELVQEERRQVTFITRRELEVGMTIALAFNGDIYAGTVRYLDDHSIHVEEPNGRRFYPWREKQSNRKDILLLSPAPVIHNAKIQSNNIVAHSLTVEKLAPKLPTTPGSTIRVHQFDDTKINPPAYAVLEPTGFWFAPGWVYSGHLPEGTHMNPSRIRIFTILNEVKP